MRDLKEQTLTPEESKERSDAQFLYEMTQGPGFKVLRQKLEELQFHTWVDPRSIDGPDAKQQWEWRELNAFHASNNAKELLEWIDGKINRGEYLEKKKRGELEVRPLTIK